MSGIHGHGAELWVDTSTNTNFTNATQVGEIISISGPDQTRDSVDISSMDSASKFREFLPGMADSGEVTFELNYDGNGTAALLDARYTAVATSWGVNFGDASPTAVTGCTATNNSTMVNLGFITALGHAIPFDDKITQSATLKFTGTPNWSAIGEAKSAE